jgi:hypothetical protein
MLRCMFITCILEERIICHRIALIIADHKFQTIYCFWVYLMFR